MSIPCLVFLCQKNAIFLEELYNNEKCVLKILLFIGETCNDNVPLIILLLQEVRLVICVNVSVINNPLYITQLCSCFVRRGCLSVGVEPLN